MPQCHRCGGRVEDQGNDYLVGGLCLPCFSTTAVRDRGRLESCLRRCLRAMRTGRPADPADGDRWDKAIALADRALRLAGKRGGP